MCAGMQMQQSAAIRVEHGGASSTLYSSDLQLHDSDSLKTIKCPFCCLNNKNDIHNLLRLVPPTKREMCFHIEY